MFLKTKDPNDAQAGTQQRGTVDDKAPRPAGLLPKKTQQFVILGVAIVMILIMWLSGGTTRKKAPAPPVAAAAEVEPPSPAAVEAFKQAIEQQQQADQKPISKTNLARLRALGLAGDVPPGAEVVPPTQTGMPEPGGAVGTVANEHPPDPIEEDKKKRAYLSLFASNIAFTDGRGLAADGVAGEQAKSVSARTQGGRPEEPIRPAVPTTDEAPPIDPALGATPVPAPPQFDVQHARPTAAPGKSNPGLSPPGAFNSFTGEKYVVFEGTIVETVLINRLNGSFSGPVNCLVTTDIYSHDRQHVLIPAGTKVLGDAKKVDAFGQQRLAVSFHRLIMPDGFSVSLDQFKGLSQTGATGLRDKVNNHYVQIFGSSLAVGILGGIAEAGSGNVLTNSPLDRAREGFGSSIANSSMNILDRFLNVLPTLTIREGYRVKIYFAGDLLLPDYAEHTTRPDL